jgi:hypothetical protein
VGKERHRSDEATHAEGRGTRRLPKGKMMSNPLTNDPGAAPRWQFSLRNLFIIMTLVAGAVALVAQNPPVATICLSTAFVVVCIRCTLYILFFMPFYARLLMTVLGTVWLLGTGFVWVAAMLEGMEPSIAWPFLMVIVVYTAFFFLGAWLIPHKAVPRPAQGSRRANE